MPRLETSKITRIKSAAEIKAMSEGGQMLATVLKVLKERMQPGMSTKELANLAAKELKLQGGKPAFLGYEGFPDVLCVSINDEVVHGIPSASRIIQDGDIVGLDFGVLHKGLITDAAITVIAGKPRSKADELLVKKTQQALTAAIDVIHDGVRVGDIAAAAQKVLEIQKLGIVRDLVGHGVGDYLHEEPNIPNFGHKNTGPVLRAGMTIAIEPMATLGDYGVFVSEDGWTVRTRDGSHAAHFEHTVLVTEDGAEILTSL
jgi:methionyl aminopeptidase